MPSNEELIVNMNVARGLAIRYREIAEMLLPDIMYKVEDDTGENEVWVAEYRKVLTPEQIDVINRVKEERMGRHDKDREGTE